MAGYWNDVTLDNFDMACGEVLNRKLILRYNEGSADEETRLSWCRERRGLFNSKKTSRSEMKNIF